MQSIIQQHNSDSAMEPNWILLMMVVAASSPWDPAKRVLSFMPGTKDFISSR